MKNILILLFLFSFASAGYSQTARQLNFVHRVKTKESCTVKNGYWYNNKCWANFKEREQDSPVIDMDSLIVAHKKLVKESKITISGKEYALDAFYPQDNNIYLQFSVVFTDANSQKTVQQKVRRTIVKARKQFLTEVKLFDGNISELPDSITPNPIAIGRIKATYTDLNKKDFKYTGILRDLINRKNTYQIDFTSNNALWKKGTSTIKFQGNKAILNGKIGMKTYAQIQNILNKHPEINTLILGEILGSVDDKINEEIGQLIKKSNLSTKLIASSKITLGGVKIFLSGNKRIITRGAKIGVNSWDNGGYKGKDLPKDHPIHQYKTPYYDLCLGDKGTDFYFYTLKTNLTNDIIWLNEEQLNTWSIATDIIDDIPIIINYPNIPESIANLGYSFGNKQSNVVIINAQENPEPYLYTDKFKELFTKYGAINPEEALVVNVHQVQTLHPENIQNKEISFEQAKQYNSETTEMLATVVKYFNSQNKKVVLVGMSYGAFVVQDLLAKHGNIVDAILLSVGRLDMPDATWKDLSQGKMLPTNNEIENKLEVQETSLLEKNKAKLIAAYGYKRYSKLLKDMNLTNTIYVYSKKDKKVGSLSKEEKAFLIKKDVLVLSVDDGHVETQTRFLKKGLQMQLK